MKFIILLLLATMSLNIFAKNYQLGFIVGAPSGLSGKYEIAEHRAIDAVLAYSLDSDYGFELHSDYIFEKVKSFSVKNSFPFDVYYGLGARLINFRSGKHNNEWAIGPRAPIGVSMDITDPNLQIFGELAVDLDILPATNLDLEGGIGVRICF